MAQRDSAQQRHHLKKINIAPYIHQPLGSNVRLLTRILIRRPGKRLSLSSSFHPRIQVALFPSRPRDGSIGFIVNRVLSSLSGLQPGPSSAYSATFLE